MSRAEFDKAIDGAMDWAVQGELMLAKTAILAAHDEAVKPLREALEKETSDWCVVETSREWFVCRYCGCEQGGGEHHRPNCPRALLEKP